MTRPVRIAAVVAVFVTGMLVPVVALSQPGDPTPKPCNPHKKGHGLGRPPCPATTTTTTTTSPTPTPTGTTGTQAATTASIPTLSPPPPGLRPVAGRWAVASVISGVVYYTPPGSHRRIKIRGPIRIEIGSRVDTRSGTIELTTAATHGTQSGAFHGGLFKLLQPKPSAHITAHRSKPRQLITTLKLVGGNFTVCVVPATRTAPAATGEAGETFQNAFRTHKRPRHKAVRHLWSSEGGGGWSTAGGDAVATVQGTWWLTEDDCNGTYVFVKQGVVVVHNLVNGRHVRLTAHHSYFARGRVRH